jgi:predicted HTH transcriptional regulator
VALGLYRARGQKTAILKVTGRDIEEREMALDFDSKTGCWACLGDAETVIASDQEQAVLEAIKQLGAPTNSEVVDVVDMQRPNCHRRILALVEKGKVKQLDGFPKRFMAL